MYVTGSNYDHHLFHFNNLGHNVVLSLKTAMYFHFIIKVCMHTAKPVLKPKTINIQRD